MLRAKTNPAAFRAVKLLSERRHLCGDLRGFGGDDGADKVCGEGVGVRAEAVEDGVDHVPEVVVPAGDCCGRN